MNGLVDAYQRTHLYVCITDICIGDFFSLFLEHLACTFNDLTTTFMFFCVFFLPASLSVQYLFLLKINWKKVRGMVGDSSERFFSLDSLCCYRRCWCFVAPFSPFFPFYLMLLFSSFGVILLLNKKKEKKILIRFFTCWLAQTISIYLSFSIIISICKATSMYVYMPVGANWGVLGRMASNEVLYWVWGNNKEWRQLHFGSRLSSLNWRVVFW